MARSCLLAVACLIGTQPSLSELADDNLPTEAGRVVPSVPLATPTVPHNACLKQLSVLQGPAAAM